MSGAAQTFIRVAEVWTPSDDGQLLELTGGIFDTAAGYAALSRMLCFSAHEGLPGHAWADARPMLLSQFDGSLFRRTIALHAAGLRCAVALPILRAGRVTSIVLLLFGDPQPHDAVAELWHQDPDPRRVGAYPETTAGADAIAIGATNRPTLHVADAQMLSLPFGSDPRPAWILQLSSPSGLPLARRIDVWSSDGDDRLARVAGWCEQAGTLATGAASATPVDALGPIGDAMRTGIAQALSGRKPDAGRRRGPDPVLPFPSVIAVPFDGDGHEAEVVALHF